MPAFLRVIILPCIILYSCSNKSNDTEIIKALNESISISNQHISRESKDVLTVLSEKLQDPFTAEKARRWYPKAQEVHKFSDEMDSFIENQKSKKINGEELYEKLIAYKRNIMTIDSLLTYTFNSSFITITKSFNSVSNKNDFIKTFFESASLLATDAMLNKLQNNIRIIENKMLLFCNEKCISTGFTEGCFSYSAIVAQSTSYSMPGQLIEITAGVGSFSTINHPEITINNKIVPLSYDGTAIYKFKSSNKPGKHYVPVKISYTDQDGKTQVVEKTVTYIVAAK